jgi:hypothetical protein
MKRILAHPITQRTRTIIRRVVITLSVIVAVAFVTLATFDLGRWPLLKRIAEERATKFLDNRQFRIGRMSLRLRDAKFIFEDVSIAGLTPEARPFFTARRIALSMTWRTLFNRRVVFDDVALTDWKMLVEQMPDNGPISFPRINRPSASGPSSWTITVPWVRAHRGEFVFEDHGTPWGIIARNIDITITRFNNEYVGTANFSNGVVDIQQWEPFRADMRSTFKIDKGRILLNRIDLKTDGARTVLNGSVDMNHWPEQMYQMTSAIDFPTQRGIFFARDTFSLSGTGRFDGTFHLFRETLANGQTRMGRELKGVIASAEAGINAHRFANFRGDVRWTPDLLVTRNASADFYGGELRFDYRMAPLGRKGVPASHTFDTELEDVDLTTYSNFLELQGLRLAGRMSGETLLQWPGGRWSERTGKGELRVTPPDGVELQTRRQPVEPASAADAATAGKPQLEPEAFSPHLPRAPVPIGGTLAFAFDPDGIDIAPSRLASPETYVEFEGRTAWGGSMSRMPFHVTSSDWQESDRLFAGFLTALGSTTPAIPVGGSGTFDGIVLNQLRRPRIEGMFAGDRMRAFDIVWGSMKGKAIIENNYADVTDAVVTAGDSTIRADGRFSIGFPRRDGGSEIDAVIRIDRRPVVDLRRAFGIEDYDVDGTLSGEFRVTGKYLTPYGIGTMRIVDGVAYGQPFETSEADVRLEGEGVRLDRITLTSSGGRGTGAAFVGFDGTYSFNFDARGLAIEALELAKGSSLPLSGLVDFSAGGSGTFESPRYDVRGELRDLFVADEGIGRVSGTLGINGEMMTVAFEAASARLAVSASGRVAMTPEMDADITLSVVDTSIDPYLRLIWPTLSPYTTAVASGNIRVAGELRNRANLVVDTTVDRFDASLFDYVVRNAAPMKLAFDRNVFRIDSMQLVGQDTELDVSGRLTLGDDSINVVAKGNANLGLLQGFFPNISSAGRAVLAAGLSGPRREPVVAGTMTIQNGRIRHFSLPHGLEEIDGAVTFNAREINLDQLSGRLAGGPVQFGGTIGIDGYLPGRFDVTLAGTSMRLRFPEGVRSLVDANFAVQGTPEAAVLSGLVTVRDAEYRQPFNTSTSLLDLSGSVPAQASAPPTPSLPLRYDIRIAAPSTLHVRNNLMLLDATANLQLQGTYDRPLLFGRAEVERGEITFEGRRYLVTRGTIDFNNPVRIDPFIDVEAETRIRVPGETYRVTVRATGTRERFSQLTFDSDPVLPQNEVLALVFGDVSPGNNAELRRYGDVTPLAQLARDRAARQIAGVVSAPVDRVAQQTLGVDTFQITPSLTDRDPTAQQSSRLVPGARLTIGKRLSGRAYLTYSRSLSSTTSDQIILLEYDQTDRFSWILSRNEDGTYAVDFRVRRTF